MSKKYFEDQVFEGQAFTKKEFEMGDYDNCCFDNCTFMNADLSTAFNFLIDPELNRIKKAIFSTNGLIGLLSKYNIEVV